MRRRDGMHFMSSVWPHFECKACEAAHRSYVHPKKTFHPILEGYVWVQHKWRYQMPEISLMEKPAEQPFEVMTCMKQWHRTHRSHISPFNLAARGSFDFFSRFRFWQFSEGCMVGFFGNCNCRPGFFMLLFPLTSPFVLVDRNINQRLQLLQNYVHASSRIMTIRLFFYEHPQLSADPHSLATSGCLLISW